MILYTNCDVRNKLANKISRQRYKRTCITFLKVLSRNAIKNSFHRHLKSRVLVSVITRFRLFLATYKQFCSLKQCAVCYKMDFQNTSHVVTCFPDNN